MGVFGVWVVAFRLGFGVWVVALQWVFLVFCWWRSGGLLIAFRWSLSGAAVWRFGGGAPVGGLDDSAVVSARRFGAPMMFPAGRFWCSYDVSGRTILAPLLAAAFLIFGGGVRWLFCVFFGASAAADLWAPRRRLSAAFWRYSAAAICGFLGGVFWWRFGSSVALLGGVLDPLLR